MVQIVHNPDLHCVTTPYTRIAHNPYDIFEKSEWRSIFVEQRNRQHYQKLRDMYQ